MKRHKLLFVDDEENILRSLKRLLHDEAYKIYTANNGYEGKKLLNEHNFSLILSDYRMPELSGVEFLKLAKQQSPETIRMILTGFADVSVAIKAINEGEVYKFIEKPWEGENLKQQIKRAIEYYELIKDRNELLERIRKQNDELKKWNENLELRVEEKAKELKFAYSNLQLKVKELEGRDSILQSLLTIHTIEESLELILDVMTNIVPVETAVIYVAEKEKNKMYPKAGLSIDESGKSIMGEGLNNFPLLCLPNTKIADDDKQDHESLFNKDDYSYYIPIKKDDSWLGFILYDNCKSKKTISAEELKLLDGFSTLAALAINEYLVTSTLPQWQSQINEVLGEFK